MGCLVVIPYSFLVGSPLRRKKAAMRNPIEIENIDELRRCQAIEDIEWHEEIERL
jgi:hypothetical protein